MTARSHCYMVFKHQEQATFGTGAEMHPLCEGAGKVYGHVWMQVAKLAHLLFFGSQHVELHEQSDRQLLQQIKCADLTKTQEILVLKTWGITTQ